MTTSLTLELNSKDAAAYWRRAAPAEFAGRSLPLAVTRTQEFLPKQVERGMTCPEQAYMMSVNMDTMRATTFVDGKESPDVAAHAGSINIFQPGSILRVIPNGNVDLCLVSLPIQLLSTVLEEAELGTGHRGEEVLRRVTRVRDRGLLILFKSFADIGKLSHPFDRLHAESLSMAIVCSLLSRYSNHRVGVAHVGEHGLSARQLKRVEEFVHEHLSQSISLSCLASIAGLSRMHFGAQFRHTTGMSPYQYVLREKIRHAQHLLSSSPTSLLQTTLDVGFLSQSHFSTVFKRVVGYTPARWRADLGISLPASDATSSVGEYR